MSTGSPSCMERLRSGVLMGDLYHAETGSSFPTLNAKSAVCLSLHFGCPSETVWPRCRLTHLFLGSLLPYTCDASELTGMTMLRASLLLQTRQQPG